MFNTDLKMIKILNFFTVNMKVLMVTGFIEMKMKSVLTVLKIPIPNVLPQNCARKPSSK